MATSPEAVRSDLLVITAAAQADIRAVAEAAPEDPGGLRAALFAATPLIVEDYGSAAAELALEWFQELRAEAGVALPYQPEPIVTITEDEIAAIVARTTESLYEIQKGIERELEEAFAESVTALEAEVQKEVATPFRETIAENSEQDPEAVGWSRHAKPGACKFCLMLSRDSAVYRNERSARFAAHPNCHCVARPEFANGDHGPDADAYQYLASQRKRTEKERKALRDYLNRKYPDAPG